MDLTDLVQRLLAYDTLAARQWVADAQREHVVWSALTRPDLDGVELSLAAGLAELLAARAGQTPTAWTAAVPGVAEPVFLVRAAETMPRLRHLCETEGPEPLRRRHLLAPPDFLTAA